MNLVLTKPFLEGGHDAVAAVGVDLEAGAMVSVSDRAVVDELPEEAGGPLDGGIDFRCSRLNLWCSRYFACIGLRNRR